MKKSHIALLIAACLLGGIMVLRDSLAQSAPATAPAAWTKIAVCDMQEICSTCEHWRDLLGRLNEDRQTANVEDEKRGKAIEAIQAEMNALKPGSPEYESRLGQLERMTLDRKVELQFQDTVITRKRRKMMIDTYGEALRAVAAVAKEQGFGLVLHRDRELVDTDDTMELLSQMSSRKVLYCDSYMDITQTVLARLNDAYRSAGGR